LNSSTTPGSTSRHLTFTRVQQRLFEPNTPTMPFAAAFKPRRIVPVTRFDTRQYRHAAHCHRPQNVNIVYQVQETASGAIHHGVTLERWSIPGIAAPPGRSPWYVVAVQESAASFSPSVRPHQRPGASPGGAGGASGTFCKKIRSTAARPGGPESPLLRLPGVGRRAALPEDISRRRLFPLVTDQVSTAYDPATIYVRNGGLSL